MTNSLESPLASLVGGCNSSLWCVWKRKPFPTKSWQYSDHLVYQEESNQYNGYKKNPNKWILTIWALDAVLGPWLVTTAEIVHCTELPNAGETAIRSVNDHLRSWFDIRLPHVIRKWCTPNIEQSCSRSRIRLLLKFLPCLPSAVSINLRHDFGI